MNIDPIIEFVLRELRLQKILDDATPELSAQVNEPIVLTKQAATSGEETEQEGGCC